MSQLKHLLCYLYSIVNKILAHVIWNDYLSHHFRNKGSVTSLTFMNEWMNEWCLPVLFPGESRLQWREGTKSLHLFIIYLCGSIWKCHDYDFSLTVYRVNEENVALQESKETECVTLQKFLHSSPLCCEHSNSVYFLNAKFVYIVSSDRVLKVQLALKGPEVCRCVWYIYHIYF